MRLTPLDSASCDAIGLLAAASVALREATWIDDATPHTPTFTVARFHDETALVAEHAWALASLVIRRGIGTDAVQSPVLDSAKRDLTESMVGLRGLYEGDAADARAARFRCNNPPGAAPGSQGIGRFSDRRRNHRRGGVW